LNRLQGLASVLATYDFVVGLGTEDIAEDWFIILQTIDEKETGFRGPSGREFLKILFAGF